MKQMYIPRGFAHGFLVLSDTAIVCYKIDNLFKEDLYRGIRCDDPQIGINWKLEKDKLKLSEKDKHNPFI